MRSSSGSRSWSRGHGGTRRWRWGLQTARTLFTSGAVTAAEDLAHRGTEFRRAVETVMAAPLPTEQAREWLSRVDVLHELHQRFTANDPAARAAWKQLIDTDRPAVEAFAARDIARVMFPQPSSPGIGSARARRALARAPKRVERGVER